MRRWAQLAGRVRAWSSISTRPGCGSQGPHVQAKRRTSGGNNHLMSAVRRLLLGNPT